MKKTNFKAKKFKKFIRFRTGRKVWVRRDFILMCFYLWVVAVRVSQPLLPDRDLLDEGVGVEDGGTEELIEVGEDVDVDEAFWVL